MVIPSHWLRLPEMFDAIVLHEFAHLVCLMDANENRLAAVRQQELARIAALKIIAARQPKILNAAIHGGWDLQTTERHVWKFEARIPAPSNRPNATT